MNLFYKIQDQSVREFQDFKITITYGRKAVVYLTECPYNKAIGLSYFTPFLWEGA